MAETITSITERLLAEVPEQYDTTEGTYTYDIEKSVAVEFDNAYDQLETVRKQSHVSTASGTYLEKCVACYGLQRKIATYATGSVTVTGTTGTILPAGSKVAAGNVMFTINDTVTVGEDGTVSAPVICDTAGTQGNVLAGYINRFPVTINGLTKVTNTHATTGGSDEETDAELRERYKEYVSRPITSGNKYQYITWAKSVPGVGEAKCIPLWNGPGTVKVVIVDADNQVAPIELIQKVQKFIDDVKPIGATLTVSTAEEITINISCKVDMSADVKNEIEKSIAEYLSDVSFTNGYVSYAKIGQAILDVNGVNDYADLTVNGGNKNIPIADMQLAVLGVVDYD